MKKAVSLLALLAFVSLSGPASAKDMNGKFGIGYIQDLGGLSGINFKYWIQDFGIDAILGMHFFRPDGGDTEVGFNIALGGLYNIARSQNANLGFGLRVNIGLNKNAGGYDRDTVVHVNIELPLVAEYFLSDHFSFFGQVGLVVNFTGDKGPVLHPDGYGDIPAEYLKEGKQPGQEVATRGFGLGLGNGGAFAQAGFCFYF